ncbi:MAG: hypothetical protein ACOX9C_05190, partial [Kiritimatiellia bacterium]
MSKEQRTNPALPMSFERECGFQLRNARKIFVPLCVGNVAMKEAWNWGVAAAASPSGEWPRKTSMWVSQAPFFAVSSKPFLGNSLREDLVEVGSGARA